MLQEQYEELRDTGQLPTPSGLGVRILVLTQKDDGAIDEIVHTIQADPALTGRIIKLASSAQVNAGHKITSVKEAAVRLGMRTVCNVSLGFTLVSANRSGRCEAFDYNGYWSWSLASAVAAQGVSRECRIGNPAESFTCALLSRVGELALASVYPTEYAEVLEKKKLHPHADLIELEREAFRINHREVAEFMLADWGLPKSFADAVRLYAERGPSIHVEETATYDLIRILHASNRIAEVFVSDEGRQARQWPALRQICEELEVNAIDMSRIYDGIAEEWKEWGAMLRVPTNAVLSFAAIEQHSKESRKAPPDGNAERLRILAVDDDPISLKLLVRNLENAGHLVASARNGREALAVAVEADPQIVVTDWVMPEMDGIELTKTLRRFRYGRNLYVLILTGRAEEERIVEAFEAGVDDYVTKPFKPKLLIARIRGGQRVVRLQELLEREKKALKDEAAKLAIAKRKYNAAAMTDPLTELPNRRYAMKRLEMEWANSSRTRAPFSIIMLDIDHFKLVNDTHGHDAGDAVLQQTAKRIVEALRAGDTCARIGGEEFLVICPNTTTDGAHLLADRIREVVQGHRIEAGSFLGAVTISAGVATRHEGSTIDTLLKAADEAVYQAKRGGRNRTSVSIPESDRRSA